MRCSACSASDRRRARAPRTGRRMPPRVRPAGRLARSAPLVVQLRRSRRSASACRMPRKPLQVRARVLALAVGRVAEPRRRRIAAGRRPVIAHVDPQPPGLGLARARDRAPAPACRRRAPCRRPARSGPAGRPAAPAARRPGRPSRPASSGRGRRLRGRRCRLCRYSGRWSQYLATSTCASSPGPARPRSIGRLGAGAWKIACAAHAGELGPHMADDLEARRHVVQLLGDVLADLAQLAAAGGAGAGWPARRAARRRLGAMHLRARAAGARAACARSAARLARLRLGAAARRRPASSSSASAAMQRASARHRSCSLELPNCSRARRASCSLSLSTISLSSATSASRSCDHAQQRVDGHGAWSRAAGHELYCAAPLGGAPSGVAPEAMLIQWSRRELAAAASRLPGALGMRQSMPSSSIDSCAGVSDTLPCVACGQTKRPRSSRLANSTGPGRRTTAP